MGGTYLIRHFTVSLFWNSPGIAPTEVDAVVALPAAAPGRLAEAALALSPASQLGGRGTSLFGDIPQRSPLGGTVCAGRQPAAEQLSLCCPQRTPGVRRWTAEAAVGEQVSPSHAALEVTLWGQVALHIRALLPSLCIAPGVMPVSVPWPTVPALCAAGNSTWP